MKKTPHAVFDQEADIFQAHSYRDGCRTVICVDCRATREVPIAEFDRVPIPRCRTCGGITEWAQQENKRLQAQVNAHGPKVYAPGYCKECGKKLSKYNRYTICFACDAL